MGLMPVTDGMLFQIRWKNRRRGREGWAGCRMTEPGCYIARLGGIRKFVSFPDFLLLCGQLLQGLSLPGYTANWIDYQGQNILKY